MIEVDLNPGPCFMYRDLNSIGTPYCGVDTCGEGLGIRAGGTTGGS